MGFQHATSGVLAGVGFAALIPAAPIPVRALAIVVTGGAALLPDLDHPAATVARSLGIVTRLLAKGVDRLSLAIYHASREGGDPPDRHSGHRLATHTIPGCLLAASLVAASCLLHASAGAAVVALLVGLLGLGLKAFGAAPALVAGGGTWWVLDQHSGWWWVFPVATFTGCLIHILGDTITNSGTPLLWPLMVGGRRWNPIRTPVTFAAGEAIETGIMRPLLIGGVIAASGWLLGVWPVLFAAIVKGGAA